MKVFPQAGGGGGNVATDTIWTTKGDLAVGTGASTAVRVAAGANNLVLVTDSAQASGLKWAATPLHAATHLPGGTDALDWAGTIHRSGTLAARPAAATANSGTLYFATDDQGGTVYRSSGSAWAQIANGLTSSVLLSRLSGGADTQVIKNVAGTWTAVDDYTDVTPTMDNSVLMGRITGGTAWVERVFPARARRRGYLGWAFDPKINAAGTALTSGTIHLASIEIELAGTIANVDVVMTTAGVTLTSGQSRVGLYRLRATGTIADLIGLSADQSANWISGTGVKTCAMTVQGAFSLAVSPGDVLYGAILSVGTTPPVFGIQGGSAGSTMTNEGLTLPDFAAATGPTAQTTLPATIDFATVAVIGNCRFFGVK